jgi:oxygen-dependent protoporphyrinogen oxidase
MRLRHDDTWELTLGDGRTETYNGVVVAIPAYETARLLESVDGTLAGLLENIPHSGTAVISLAYDRDQIGHSLDGMGVVVPAVEGRDLLALSLSSQKYPHRAPPGKVLVRAFLGGACRPELLQLDDEQLRMRAVAEVADLLQTRGQPELCTIARWPSTMPQYHVGHQNRIAAIRERTAQIPNIELAGKAYGGVGMPDCIRSGELAAQGILENLRGYLSFTSRSTGFPLRSAA